jgi:prepilin-type N-terminal cleavage/methylation domain-containing protein
MKKKYNMKNQKGFSLIEMMVVVAILGIIVLALVTFFTGGVKSWVSGQSQLKAQREARQAIDRMVREIREGKNIINVLPDISDADTIVVFIPDLGSKPAYKATYDLSGTTVQRNTNPLIDNVQSLVFTYFDSSGNLVASGNASKVHIDFQVDVDKDGNPDITLNTDVNLRNYGL